MKSIGGISLVIVAAIGVFALWAAAQQDVQPPQAATPKTTVVATATVAPTQEPMKDVQELTIEDTKVGTGAEVKSGDVVLMHYSGTLLDGTKFDSSYDRGKPFETQIGVGRVIQGWDEGVPGMKVGGKRRLIIPGDKAYGAAGVPGAIPPNATLVFDVELLGVK